MLIRRSVYLGMATGLAFMLLGTDGGPHPDPEPWAPLTVGQNAPEFSLPSTEGQRWSWPQGQRVWVSFGTSWCARCQQQIGIMRQVGQDGSGVQVAFVDELDSQMAARAFVDRLRVAGGHAPSILVDRRGAIGALYHVPVYPTSYLIGGSGRVLGVYFGAITSPRQWKAFDRRDTAGTRRYGTRSSP